MKRLVYDLPTRLFHWLFAILFLFTFFIGKTIDDESPLFSYHMMAGLTIGFLVTLRIIWGVFGSQHARFSHFALHPKELILYMKNVFSGVNPKWSGHNPASSWAAIIMMMLALGSATTGFLMTSGGDKEALEEIHEVFANGFIVLVIFHISGIILHTVRYKDMIGLSMIDGKKNDVPENQAITSSHAPAAAALLLLVLLYAMNLITNYNSQNQTLNFFGTQLQLGENEEEGEGEKDSSESEENEEGEEHDDD